MSKHYLSLVAFATLLCLLLFGAASCKKDDTSDPSESSFFVDVDFLPKAETNGAVAPRLMANFNDEMVMIEIRPSADSAAMESVLFLCPGNEAMLMCGNDSLMFYAAYDLETYTPSHDVLLVTQMDDYTLLLTKCFMDWNTNTLTKHDMMVLPIDGISKKHEKRGDIDGEIRSFFFNRFVKPLAEKFEIVESFCGVFGIQGGMAFTYIKTTITTGLTTILYSDDPEGLYDAMEFPVEMWATEVAQSGVLNLFPQKLSDMASRIIAGMGWFSDGGHGKVNDNVGNGGANEPSYPTILSQSMNLINTTQVGTLDPAFIVNLAVSNITENSVYLKGSYRFGNNSSLTPVEMGYVFSVSGGEEQTKYDMDFQGIALTGLQKATKYTAFAYVKNAFGDRVLSPGVTFWTLGFEALPTSLTFTKEGGSQSVGLSYSSEDIPSWDITSKPSWCSITIVGNRMFAVEVGRTTETRSGTITVTGNSNALGTVTQNITVTQLGSDGWDGTSWLFTGVVTSNDFEGQVVSEEMTLTLMVNSVSDNNITFSWAQALSATANNGYSDNYVVNSNGNLVYSATAGYSGEWGSNNINSQVTFVRTGPTTATADLHYRETFSNYIATASGTLQGTLINAKEIGDYNTNIHLNTPMFNKASVTR